LYFWGFVEGKLRKKRQLVRPRRGWEDNVKNIVKKWDKGLHSEKGQVMGCLKDGNKSWLECVGFF
jgi:hypothetical protein